MTGFDIVTAIGSLVLVAEFLIKVVAIGVVPENRRPSSSTAWLLLILMFPIGGLIIFLLLGSPYVHGRRHRIQAQANEVIDVGFAEQPDAPEDAALPQGTESFVVLNRRLTGFACVTGRNEGVFHGYNDAIAAMAAAVDEAKRFVHVEVYIVAWDHTTDVFFQALSRAVARGVEVRLLLDDIGSRKYPGFKELGDRFDAAGIQWHLMMPINILGGRFRRPDLRNHRKLVVVDGDVAFMGSQNMIDSTYLQERNVKVGRHWNDSMIRLTGQIVTSIDAVFAVDWYTECGERLQPRVAGAHQVPLPVGGDVSPFQLIPSGPGYATEPNLRLFTSLVHSAQEHIGIVSPYFVPDESLLAAVTTACYRGVAVELYVSEQADQFAVDHAQSSYYRALLEAGVRIHRLPKPAVLHSKFFVVDDTVAVFGSSNLDMRSFGLDYEITLLGFGGTFVADLTDLLGVYRERSSELALEEWTQRSRLNRYLDNLFRLTSALQ